MPPKVAILEAKIAQLEAQMASQNQSTQKV
jgi:hypothetical protein